MNIRSISSVRVKVVALSSALIAIGSFLAFFEWHIPSQNARLFQDPIADIHNIRISPGNNFSLVNHDVEITNTVTIQLIVTTLRSAKKYFPNHPGTRWSCGLAISSSSGTSFIDVIESYGQGTILYCTTLPNGGHIYDTLQSDKMGQILEEAKVHFTLPP
jgi:hypothetical protein